ncbi:MAG: dodecin family protein [Vulcanimicrobiaceae bacterium]
MAMLKVIEVLAQSEDSWEDAAREAIRHASETVRGIRSIYIKNFEAEVEDDEVTMFRINAKISFLLESEADEDEDEDEEEDEEEEE